MPGKRDGWPPKAREEQYLDAQKRYILLTSDVFEKEWGPEWYTLRIAKAHSSVDFSGRNFFLETLTGEPEKGLLHPGVRREHIEVLNVSKNQLTDISCLNKRTDGYHDFRNLQILNASRNMLTEVRLELTNLTMLNLSYNELVKLPSFSLLRELQKLVLSHNQIDATLREFVHNTKLWYLDLSSNQFSWRPSLFKEQLECLGRCHIRELKLWPNPFAEHFKEYQFLTVTELDSLTSLDGFFIDHDLRAELRIEADKLRGKGVDYTVFDIKVEEKKKLAEPVKDTGADITGSNVPRMSELIATLNQILDRPDELHKHINDFEEQVKGLWGSHYHDRKQLMEVVATPEERELGVHGARVMSPEEERQVVNEFSDKMQQVLERYDSVQDVLVMCLVRLLACGSALLSQRCARLLAEWIDASAAEFQGRISEISRVLFKDLRARSLSGIQSVNESPFECYEASHNRLGEDPAQWGRLESVAECACILRALGCFGSSAIFAKADSPFRALMLEPLMPALCRAPRGERGADQPPDEWAAYRGYDAFPRETVDTLEIEEGSLALAQERCARFGFGGFVLEESPEQPSMLKVMFKANLPDALSGMRVPCPGRTLHIRPSKAAKPAKRAPDPSGEACEAWSAWVSGIAVLAVATTDKFNAARCVSEYGIHAAICRHDTEPNGFTEAWLLVTEDASRGFVSLLRVAQNLTHAAAPHGQEATKYFMEHGLHMNCWNRVRRRLMENGAAIPMSRLNESDPDFTLLISSLVGVICAMTEAGTPEVADAVMTDLRSKGMDVFNLLLEVCAYAGVPDPVLLATSLEMIYTFLDSSITRSVVLARVLTRLHDSAILLPYIKGPKVNDVNNLQYQELWRVCMVRYGAENLAQERMPELFVSANDYSATDSHGGQAGRQAERGKWRSRVPELRDLQHPLMHRVLLGIVRLIKLFSLNSQNDTTGLLKNVADLLNDQGREKLLIGPATGLVMCPDFDVKIQCLQVIEHVLETSPQQLSPEEMGWLMQYLTSAGLGLGKQEEFLMEVVHLITLLVSDQTKAGHTFRHRFAKLAIRESFEILRLNSRREVKGEAEQESKKGVSLKTIQLLQVSSQPLSGGLRKFLRRVDFLTCLKEVLVEEDRDDRPGIQAAVLSTWTGRNMREVLLPMVGGSDIRPRGRGRYHALVRLADVLQGRSDRVPGSKLQAVPPSDERDFWPSVATMLRVENDQMEEEDWTNQQRVFVTSAGVSQLLKFAERYLTGDVAVERFRRCQSLVESFGIASSQKVKRWWEDRPASHEDAKSGEDARINEKHLSAVEECFMTRLRIINQRVSELYGYNLNVYDEGRGSSLVQLAKDLAKHFTESQEMHRKYYEMHPYEYEALMKRENEYLVGSRLMSIRAAMKRGLRLEKPRQPHGDLKRLLEQAAAAHQYLKGVLIARHPHNDKDAEEWARSHLERGKEDVFRRRIGPKGLALFLRNHEAQVIDPGVEPQQTILRKHAFKYFNDNTRVRNAVRLIIEYPDAGKLNASLKEIVHAGAFSVVRIRNRFALPSNLARRCVAVNIEIQLAEVKHMAELELVIRHDAVSTQDTLARESMLMDTLEKSLRDSCQVKAKAVEQVAEFLCNEVESRSMRHCDAVILKCGESNLEVQREEVVVQSDVFNADQTFILEREGGIGVVKSGDVISLKCKQTGLYLDMTSNGNLRCRFGDAMSQQSNLRFIIEIDLLEEEPSGVAGGLVGWFGGDALAQTQGRAHKGAHGAPVTNLHTGSRIKIKAKGSNRYITVMSGATYLGLAGEKRRVKGHPLEDNNAEGQTLSIIREGAMQEYLNLDGTTDAAQQPGLADAVSAEERHEHLLLEAHMCTALPSLDSCPREGGVFRSAPPAFRVVAQRQAQAESRHETVSSDEDKSSLDSELSRMPLVISAILRCNYVLIEFPESPSTRNHALGQILAGALGSTSRYLVATMTVQHALHSDTPEEEPDIISAWLPAKLLRLFSAALSHVPALCANPDRREETSEDIREREKAAARERKKAERGEYDQKRVELLDIIAQYMSQMLIQSLLVRLSVVTHRSLSIQEVVLLRELATLVDRMVYNFFSNELRCVKKHRNGQKQEPTPPQLQQGGDQPPARPADQAAALEDDAAGGAVGMLGLMFADESVPKLSRETEAEIFASMVPRATTHVLVQAMLYAVHQEAIAFTAGFKTHDLTVRLISSLANRSISALSAVMHGRSGSEATACEFHICESVSQAMSHGAQLVPRARIMQLMEERAIDKLRGTMEELMQDGDFDPGLPDVPMTHSVERPVAKSTERIVVIARCWAGPVDEAHLTLPRCLVAVTSRMNLAVVSLPPDATGTGTGTDQLKVGGPPPSKEELDVVSFRDLRRLQRTVVSGKMRQFLGLWWDDSEDCQREVLIFDSSSRRRAFQQVLRMVEGASRRDQRRGVPSVELRSEVRDVLQETCKRDNRNNTALVNVSFVRSRTRAATSSWSETWTGSSDHAQPEVLLMTVDTVAVITLTSFLQKYARADDAQAYASLAHGHALLDTDSEDEEDPGQYKQPGQAGESVVKCQTLYSSPWQLKQLEGVWFLAEAEPRIKLRFERTEEFLFSSDGERQRWRRHLAVVLANQERRQQDDRARNQGWSVLATGKTEIADVRQYAMTHAHRSLDRSLGAEQPRALTNATKAAG